MSKLRNYIFIFSLLVVGFSAKQAFANTCTPTGAGGNWSSSATWTACGGVAPTAADDVQLNNAVSVTIDGVTATPNFARSLDMTGYSGTLTAGATAVLTLGDATAGASNIALKVAGTFNPNAASTINFISTSATQQTVDTGGKTMGNLTFNSASNGNYAITTNLTTATASAVTLTKGTLHMDGASDNSGLTHSIGKLSSNNANVRTLNLGTSNTTTKVASSGVDFAGATNLTLTATASTINMTGASSAMAYGGSGAGSGLSLGTLNVTGGGATDFNISAGSTFVNLSITATAVKTDTFNTFGNITVTGSLTLAGNSVSNRLYVSPRRANKLIGTNVTWTVTGATVSVNNTDLQDILFANGGSSLDLTNSGANSVGDSGGNAMSGGGTLTVTTPATQYWTGESGSWSVANQWCTSSGGCSDNLGNGRTPLPQDTAIFDNGSFSGTARTVTMDMPRQGKDIDWSAYNEGQTPTYSVGTANAIYGSLTLIAGMTKTLGAVTTFETRTTSTLTTAGGAWTSNVVIQDFGGSLTLQDAMSVNTNSITFNTGTFDANGFNVTAGTNTFASSAAVIINGGGGTWTLMGTGNPWNMGASTAWSAQSSTIILSNTTATSKAFLGSGKTYNTVTFTGQNITVSGANTFATLNLNTAGLPIATKFTASVVQTITTFSDNGSAGNLVFASSTTAVAATLTKAGGGTVCVDFLNIQSITGTPSSTWFVGANSTDSTNNTGLSFTACAAGGGGSTVEPIIYFTTD